MISDNLGPRLAIFLSWGTCLIGCILMGISNGFIILLVGVDVTQKANLFNFSKI